MKFYLRILAVLYGFGALIHLMQWLDVPPGGHALIFSNMPPALRAAVKVFLFLDTGAAVGLWLGRMWGITFFLLAAFGQMILYLGFSAIYGGGLGRVPFHAVTLTGYWILWWRTGRPVPLK